LLRDTPTGFENVDWLDNALIFDVVNLDKPRFVGSAWLDVALDVGGSTSPEDLG
jgi:lipopolysaccharide transport system ATP-binding protein